MKINPHNYNPSYDWSNRRSFDEATINAARARSSDNPAAVVSISLEALAKAASPEVPAENATDSMYCNYIRSWYHEVYAEAHKNGTSFEEAMKTHGKEIAEFVVGEKMKLEAFVAGKNPEEYPEGREQKILDESKAFLDGIARHINGESLKDAFKDYDIEKAAEKWGSVSSNTSYCEKFDKASNSKIVGYWSQRYERYVFPPEPEQSEEINEDIPQKEYVKKAPPKDRNAIFKDVAGQMIASLNKKENGVASGHIKIGDFSP